MVRAASTGLPAVLVFVSLIHLPSDPKIAVFSSALPARYPMRYFPTFLICTFISFGAIAQESSPNPESEVTAEVTPTPAQKQEDSAPVQQSLNSPTPTSPKPDPSVSEAASAIVDDLPSAAQTLDDLKDLMPSGDSPREAYDPATLAAGGEEQERKAKIRYQQVRTQVDKDPEVASLLDKAKKARTFEGERAAYREYYRTLFRRMKKVDPTLAKKCDQMEKAYLDRMAQTRVEPTIPLEPPPKP